MRGNGGVIGPHNVPTTTTAGGVWSPTFAAAQSRRSNIVQTTAWPTVADPNFASVTGLWHCTSYTNVGAGAYLKDSSTLANAGVFQAVGTQTHTNAFGLVTSQSKFDGTSLLCNTVDTGGQAVAVVQSGLFNFGTADCTVEFWMYPTLLATTLAVLDFRTARAASTGPIITVDNSGVLTYSTTGVAITSASSAVAINNWYFVAWSRVSGVSSLYLNTARQGSATADTVNQNTSSLYIGGCVGSTPNNYFSGYIQDVRVTKGVGRYSGATITVPTAPFPDY